MSDFEACMQCDLPELCRDAGVRESLAHFVRSAGINPVEIVDIAVFGSDAEQIDQLADIVVVGMVRTENAFRCRATSSSSWPMAVVRVQSSA